MIDTTNLKQLMLDIQRSAWQLDQLIQEIENVDDITDSEYIKSTYLIGCMKKRTDYLECFTGLDMSEREKRLWKEMINPAFQEEL